MTRLDGNQAAPAPERPFRVVSTNAAAHVVVTVHSNSEGIMRCLLRSSVALTLCTVAVGCGGGGGDSLTAPSQTVATVTISPSNQTMTVGQTLQLTADVRDGQGRALSGQTISWTSSAPSIVSVSTTGLATAQLEGQATITATAGGKTGQAVVTGTYPYPSVGGTWDVRATFDALPPSTSFVSGTFVLTQTSRLSGGVTGVANLTGVVNGQVFPMTNLVISGTLTSNGGLTLVIMDASTATWSFTAVVTGNTTSGGRHTLSGSGTPISGNWSATRTVVTPRVAQSAQPAQSLQDLLQALPRR